MAETRVTEMVVKVDLKCDKCKMKIKKLLCKISQIENQVYDEKNNTVTITVVCCNPEKIKKKIFCKGGDIIMGIEIVKPIVPNPDPAPKPPRCDCCRECYVFDAWGPCYQGHGWPSPPCYCSCHGCYGRPVCDCWGSGCRRCYVICEENPTICTIM